VVGGTTAFLIQLPVFSRVLLVVQGSLTTQTGRRDTDRLASDGRKQEINERN
jgi:hypothetical protein